MVAFYTAALGYEPFGSAGDRYRSIVAPDGNGPKLVFQKVPEPKLAKNRVHLDLIVGDAIDAEVERFVALGAAPRSRTRSSTSTARAGSCSPIPRATSCASARRELSAGDARVRRGRPARAGARRARTRDGRRRRDARPADDARAVASHVAVPRRRRRPRCGRGRTGAAVGAGRLGSARRGRCVPEGAARAGALGRGGRRRRIPRDVGGCGRGASGAARVRRGGPPLPRASHAGPHENRDRPPRGRRSGSKRASSDRRGPSREVVALRESLAAIRRGVRPRAVVTLPT